MLENPKQTGLGKERATALYPYYAGYSASFVASALKHSIIPDTGAVLDPWNGSGTTTKVCAETGRPSIGFDLNPCMVVVAKAQILQRSVDASLGRILRTLVRRATKLQRVPSDDPLLDFFDGESSRAIRGFAAAINDVLVDKGILKVDPRERFRDLSSLAAFYYVLLFRVVRKAVSSQQASNPTWIKLPKGSKLSLRFDSLVAGLDEELASARGGSLALDQGITPTSCDIELADSRDIPLANGSVSAVITSPPYCTRIDYAVATRVELAVIGLGSASGFGALRTSLIGSTLTSKNAGLDALCLPDAVQEVLTRIKRHPSKASATYYYQTFLEYFVGVNQSIGEIARVLSERGAAVIVVQDSYYKDEHIDLAGLLRVMGQAHGLEHRETQDFAGSQTMRTVHKHARENARRNAPVESAVIMVKP